MILGFSESMPVYFLDEAFIEEDHINSTHLAGNVGEQEKTARRKLSSTKIDSIHDESQGKISSDNDAYDTYDIFAYIDDQSWFNEAQRQNAIVFDGDAYKLDEYKPENSIYRLAIQMSAPIEEGGLPPALVQIMADDESSLNDLFEEIARYMLFQSEHPARKFSVFGFGDRDSMDEQPVEAAKAHIMAGSNVEREDQESLANLIVEKISQSVVSPSSHTRNDQQYYFDPRWFGLLFGFVCIVFLVVGTTITALRTESNAYMVVGDYQPSHEPQEPVYVPKDEQRPTHRKISGLPA
jgi:hypothetical protein